MKRIEQLRLKALEQRFGQEDFYASFWKHYLADDAKQHPTERYTAAYSYAFENLKPFISDGELIVGKCDFSDDTDAATLWLRDNNAAIKQYLCHTQAGQDSHMTVDYELVLKQGLYGIIENIRKLSEKADGADLAFYTACQKCLEAVIQHSNSYAKQALKLSEICEDPARRAELIRLSEICRRVPAYPAESFYEAVQSVHFISYCLTLNPLRLCWQQFQLGRPDRYLYEYYLRDKQNGTLTDEFAQLLLDCLGIQINNRVINGLSCGYMVGGRDKNGNTVANELTDMCMQVVDDIRLVYPAVGLCYTADMPDSLLEKACNILLHGRSHPAIFNDEIITKGLMSYGVPENEAHDYIHSTCVEITPVASSNVWVASPYTNLAQILLDCLDREYSSITELLEHYYELLDSKIKENFEQQNSFRLRRAEHSINPLLSCFVNDCLENGKDIEQGGARYNWIMPSFVGMANLVDALYAIDHLVFKERSLTVAELKTVLDNDFENAEALRQKILRLPKYGNDIDEIDSYFPIITEHITTECEKYTPMLRNGRLIPSVFCWIMHERLGSETGATPDGRKAHFPLGDGSGPCQGRELNGPTASILSSTKWDHHRMIGGVAVNMKFSKHSLGESSDKTLCSLIKTFIARGGFEIQINIIDNETLKKAQQHPEDYRDLVVRIGGYSDYFVKLSENMQNEIILRTEHEL